MQLYEISVNLLSQWVYRYMIPRRTRNFSSLYGTTQQVESLYPASRKKAAPPPSLSLCTVQRMEMERRSEVLNPTACTVNRREDGKTCKPLGDKEFGMLKLVRGKNNSPQ